MCEDLEDPKQKDEEVGQQHPGLPASVSILEIPLLTDIVEIEYQE